LPNIAFRRQRRTKSPIAFVVEAELAEREIRTPLRRERHHPAAATSKTNVVQIKHQFAFRATAEGIKARFQVVYEQLEICSRLSSKSDFELDVRVSRDDRGAPSVDQVSESGLAKSLAERLGIFASFAKEFEGAGSAELMWTQRTILTVPLLRHFVGNMSQIATYKLSPALSRNAGVPTPNQTSISLNGRLC